MARRTSPPRPPAVPPADAEAGAALVCEFVVKLYDRQNGKGVNWEEIAATLFRASFDALRELPPPRKQAFANRVHQRSYEAMTDDPEPSNSGPAAADPAPSNTAGFKSLHPNPPR
jgi:hypothetical protein